ncbi:MAG: hypothetical protein AAGJ28_08255 [Pseudomonadota bacterium]
MNTPRPLTPDEIYARTQRPQSDDPGPIGAAEKPCAHSIRFVLEYDDTWGTRITDVPVKLTDNTGVLVDGDKRTTSLKTFGKQDGDDGVADVLARLGMFEHNCVEPGFATFETVPDPGAEGDVRSLEQQTLGKLKAFESEMEAALKRWVDDWEANGWLTVAGAARDGLVNGVSTWWEGESEFWESVGDGISDAWEAVKRGWNGTLEAAQWWFLELSPLERLKYTTALVTTLAESLWNGAVSLFEDAVDLWERRDDFFNVIRAFYEGSIDAIESALDLLRDLTGEIGEIFLAAITQASDWIQLLNESIRQSDVIPALGGTLGRVMRLMVPNFWAQGLGSVAGYLIPEVLIAIILTIIAALSAGAGATALAARIVQVLDKIKDGLRAADTIGGIIVNFIDKIDEIAKLIARLAKRAKQNIDLSLRRATGRTHEVEVPVKRTRPPKATYRHGASDGGPGEWGQSTRAGRGADYQEQATGAPRGTEYKVPYSGNQSGVKWMDGYDPEADVLIDAKDWDAWPPTDRVFPSVERDLREAAQIARETGTPVQWRVPTQTKADQLLDIVDDLGLDGVDVVPFP